MKRKSKPTNTSLPESGVRVSDSELLVLCAVLVGAGVYSVLARPLQAYLSAPLKIIPYYIWLGLQATGSCKKPGFDCPFLGTDCSVCPQKSNAAPSHSPAVLGRFAHKTWAWRSCEFAMVGRPTLEVERSFVVAVDSTASTWSEDRWFHFRYLKLTLSDPPEATNYMFDVVVSVFCSCSSVCLNLSNVPHH